MDDEPAIKKQIDSFCKIAMIVSGTNSRKFLDQCEQDIEEYVLKGKMDEFDKKYEPVLGKDTIGKTYAIESILLEVINGHKNNKGQNQ